MSYGNMTAASSSLIDYNALATVVQISTVISLDSCLMDETFITFNCFLILFIFFNMHAAELLLHQVQHLY